jgi:signal peptidase II
VAPARSGQPVEAPAVAADSGRAAAKEGIGPWPRALALAAVVLALDQITKLIVVGAVERGDPHEIIFGLEIANVRNKGVAFGLLAGGEVPVLLITIGALALLLTYFAVHTDAPSLWIAVGLLLGGAVGNLLDRLRIDAVIDFLDPPLWPAFNLADVAIVAGVALLVVSLTAPQKAGSPGIRA